jgi:hypothetical protein
MIHFYWEWNQVPLNPGDDDEPIDDIQLYDMMDDRTWELEKYVMGDQHPNRSVTKQGLEHGRWLTILDRRWGRYGV